MPLIAASTLAGGIAASLLFSIDLPLLVAVALAAGSILLLSVGWPVMITFSTEVSSGSRATGVGLLGLSNQSGAVGGAAIGGVLLAAIGFPGVGYLCLGAAVLSSVVIALFMRRAGADGVHD